MIAGTATTRKRSGILLLASLAILGIMGLPGCKRQEPTAESSSSAQTVDDSELIAMHKAMTENLKAIAFDKLTPALVGQRLVIKARTPDRADPPPPPRGMVLRMGPTSIYSAELHEVLADSLKIRAAYPTSGNLKIIEIPQADIQTIHMSR
jgi:hypothetical protein